MQGKLETPRKAGIRNNFIRDALGGRIDVTGEFPYVVAWLETETNQQENG